MAMEAKTAVSKSYMEWDGISNPFLATIGLRIDPATADSGVQFSIASEVLGTMPLAFFKAVEETVYETLQEGVYGWQVMNCLVTMTHSGYWPRQSTAHGGFDKNISSTARDFRNLTPLVLMSALSKAGSIVCEPIHHFELTIPIGALAAMSPVMAKLGAVAQTTVFKGSSYSLSGDIPAAHIHELQQQLPGLTGGEGVLESNFDCYQPVRENAPVRPRTDYNPLVRREYLLNVMKHTER